MIQTNRTALPHQKPLGTGVNALDAGKPAVEQMSTPKYSKAEDTFEFLVCY